jgi:hypothetical protein
MESAMMLNFSKSSAAMVEAAEAGCNLKFGAPPEPARIYEAKDGTPGMAAAALGTAHGVRVRKAEQWAAARMKQIEEGGKWGRKRGKGAQLRRQLKKKQRTMDEWRRQQTSVDPGAARAKAQGMGHTRDLSRQLGESRCRQRRAEQQMHAAEACAVEAERQMGIMTRLLERRDIRQVEQLQRDKHDAVSSRQGAERRLQLLLEETEGRRQTAQRNMRGMEQEAAVVLRVLRLEVEMAEKEGGREGVAVGATVRRQVDSIGSMRLGLVPRRLALIPPAASSPPPCTAPTPGTARELFLGRIGDRYERLAKAEKAVRTLRKDIAKLEGTPGRSYSQTEALAFYKGCVTDREEEADALWREVADLQRWSWQRRWR